MLRNCFYSLILLSLVFLHAQMPAPATAAVDQHKAVYLGSVLSAVDLSGAAGTRTFIIGPRIVASDYTDSTVTTTGEQLRGFSKMQIEVKYSHNNNGTITTTCTGGATRTTATSSLTTCTVSSGTCTLNFAGVMVTSSLSADKDWLQYLGLNGENVVQCVIAHGGTPDSSDLVTVNVTLMAD